MLANSVIDTQMWIVYVHDENIYGSVYRHLIEYNAQLTIKLPYTCKLQNKKTTTKN